MSTTIQPLLRLSALERQDLLELTVTLSINPARTITAKAMVDSGATTSFMDKEFARLHNIPVKPLEETIPLEVVDGRPIVSGHVTHSTRRCMMTIMSPQDSTTRLDPETQAQQHQEDAEFYITSLGKHQIILGTSWLEKHNPTINWTTRTASFTSDFCQEKCGLRKQPNYLDSINNTSVTSSQRSIVNPHTPSPDTPKVPLIQQIPKEYHDYLDVFSKVEADKLPDHTEYDHEMPLEKGAKVPFGPIYSLSQVELQALDTYLKENQEKGFIRPSTSPAGAPILFVKKKGTPELRLCVDYRGLNKVTIKNRYPLPLIQENLDRLSTAKYYTKIDLRGAYNLIRIKEGEEWKTAFRTRYGLFEYLVMPFGLTNAPATFQHVMNSVLRDMLDISVIVYLDDILIYSDTREQHILHVKAVLERLRRHKLWAKAEKCEFFTDRVEFLGYVISPAGIEMDRKKVEKVLDWPNLKTVKDVQIFLGFANYYRKFIANYSKLCTPLTRLLRKDITFKWDDPAQKSFDALKTAFTTAPILTHFDPARQIIIETDASDFAIAGVISHPDLQEDGTETKDPNKRKLHPIAFFSRKLSPAELNYEIYDKEMLAIVESFRNWRAYTEGSEKQIVVYTDHKNLQWFTTTRTLNRRQARWARDIAPFDFTIVYRPGTLMGKPDALSRRQDFQEGSRAAEAAPRTLLKPGQLQMMENQMENKEMENKETETLWLAPLAVVPLEQDMLKRIQEQQRLDPELQHKLPYLLDPDLPQDKDVRKELSGYSLHPNYMEEPHYLILFNDKISIPDNLQLRLDIISQCHDGVINGHPGREKTYNQVARAGYHFPGIRKFITTYVSGCQTCMRNKSPRHTRYGLLQSLPIPETPWTSLSMDAIVKLPLSGPYDSIMVIVDRLTKMSHFIPFTEKGFDSPELAKLFQKNIFRLHGIPKDIVSDRGPTFNSKFWRAFTAGLGIKCNFSTAFHPQSDGQTERVNQTLEQYLRIFCDYEQKNWADLLDVAEFTYNNTEHSTTQHSPFYANTGVNPLHPATILNPDGTPVVPNVTRTLESVQQIHKELQDNIKAAQANHAKYYNRKAKDPQGLFKVGDLVWLNRRNIKTRRPSRKLDQHLLGPYRILQQITDRPVYKLDIPPRYRIHDTFHASLLEPHHPGHPGQQQGTPPRIEIDGEEEFILEKIRDGQQDKDGNWEYLVQWDGYSEEHNSWEPIEEVQNTVPFRRYIKDNPTKGPASRARQRRT